jgi:hypothetical protein
LAQVNQMPPSVPSTIDPGASSPGRRVSVAVVVPAGISPIAPLVDGSKPPPGTYSVNHRLPWRSNASEVTTIDPDPLMGIDRTLPALVMRLIAAPPSANQPAPSGPRIIGNGWYWPPNRAVR